MQTILQIRLLKFEYLPFISLRERNKNHFNNSRRTELYLVATLDILIIYFRVCTCTGERERLLVLISQRKNARLYFIYIYEHWTYRWICMQIVPMGEKRLGYMHLDLFELQFSCIHCKRRVDSVFVSFDALWIECTVHKIVV